MKFEKLNKGPFNGPLANGLSMELAFDPLPVALGLHDTLVFIAGTDAQSDGGLTLPTGLPNSVAPGPVHGLNVLLDAEGHSVASFPDAAMNARTGLEIAETHAATDLSLRAKVMTIWAESGDTSEVAIPVDSAGAKPDWAKSSDSDTQTSDSSATKGRGKKKANSTEDTADTGSTDTGSTDTGSTDTGSTDTGSTDTGSTDTGSTGTGSTDTGQTSGSGSVETNTGSSDPNTYVSGLDTPDGFNIEIVFIGAWTERQKQGFYDAAELISDVVQGDVAAHNGIDDIRISATMTSIDGSGGYWGWGGVTSARPDSLLPSQGYMRFDIADADTVISYGYGMWEDLIFHEMLHAMGFGVSWDSMGLVENYGGDLRFTGENAINAYHDSFADIAAKDALSAYGVPIETDGGSGTAGVHWDDATFGTEVMTGTLRWTDTISDMTIAALEDMGYQTTYPDAFQIV